MGGPRGVGEADTRARVARKTVVNIAGRLLWALGELLQLLSLLIVVMKRRTAEEGGKRSSKSFMPLLCRSRLCVFQLARVGISTSPSIRVRLDLG